MKKCFYAAFCLAGLTTNFQTAFTQPADLKQILSNGPTEKRLNIVFLSEGYTQSQLLQFENDATTSLGQLFSTLPLSTYSHYFNAFLIGATSQESGSDHPSRGIYRNTVFNSTESDPRRAPEHSMAGGGGRTTLAYFLILCVAMTLAGFSYRGTSLVLPAAFREQATFFSDRLRGLQVDRLSGISNLAAATLASLTYGAGMIGQLWGGRLAGEHDLRKLHLLFHGCSLPFLLAMAFAREVPLLLFACGFVFFSLGMQPIENSLVARFTPQRCPSTSYGVKFVLNFGVGIPHPGGASRAGRGQLLRP